MVYALKNNIITINNLILASEVQTCLHYYFFLRQAKTAWRVTSDLALGYLAHV